jgi:hypothetical protein
MSAVRYCYSEFGWLPVNLFFNAKMSGPLARDEVSSGEKQ